jgi:hypothetical protein
VVIHSNLGLVQHHQLFQLNGVSKIIQKLNEPPSNLLHDKLVWTVLPLNLLAVTSPTLERRLKRRGGRNNWRQHTLFGAGPWF